MRQAMISVEKVLAAQAGDLNLREKIISDSIPDIKRIVRRVSHTISVSSSDEFSIALEAFNQSIDHFKPEMNVPFLYFASAVIKNRLCDWFRTQKTTKQVLTFSDCETINGIPIQEKINDPASERIHQDLEFEESIISLEYQLSQFGYSVAGLTDSFPKHRDSRLFCVKIARQLDSNNSFFNRMLENRRLPASDLARFCNVSVKTIEKNRSSIIFLVLLLRSDLSLIHSYLDNFEKGDIV